MAISPHKRTRTIGKHAARPNAHLGSLLADGKARRLFYIYTACIVVSALAAGLLATAQQPVRLPDPFSAEQRTVVAFRLYYPNRLPTPYYVDEASLGRLQETVVTMRITDGSGKGNTFTISQQALPQGFDLEAFYQSFGERSTFTTPLGKAMAGTIDNGNSRLISLVTDEKTWILIQAPLNVDLDIIQMTLKSFSPSI